MKGLVLLALVAPAVAFASPEETLAKVQATYRGAKQVSGAFAQSEVDEVFGRTTKSTGTFELANPNKLRIEYVRGGKLDKAFIFDGTTLWIDAPKNLEVTKIAGSMSDIPAGLAWLGKLDGVTVTAPSPTTLTLVPEQASAAFTKLELVIDPKTSTVTRSIVTAPSGNTSTFELSNIDLAAKLDGKRFTWSAADHKNYKITTRK